MAVQTIGELKKALAEFPDDMPIAIYRSDMGKNGYQSDVFLHTDKMMEISKCVYDVSSKTSYTYPVLVSNSTEGQLYLKIS